MRDYEDLEILRRILERGLSMANSDVDEKSLTNIKNGRYVDVFVHALDQLKKFTDTDEINAGNKP